jgi:small subunit ribosomal protein S6
MNHYEIMYIVPVKATGEEPTAVQDKVRAMLQASGAKVTSEDSLGKRKLAYPIDHVRHGNYVVLECDLPADQVKTVNDWFRLSPDVLRAMVVAKKVKSPEQLERERALQAKLARIHAKAEEATRTSTQPAANTPTAEQPKVNLEELDKKLEQILEEEVK